jgi:hypothetical protein
MQVHPITKSRLNTIHVKGNVSLEEKCQFAIEFVNIHKLQSTHAIKNRLVA